MEDIVKFWVHTKTSTKYVIHGFGVDEKTMEPIVIYQAIGSLLDPEGSLEGPIWTRPCEDFFDGRFTQESWSQRMDRPKVV